VTVSPSRYKFTGVYTLYGVCILTSVSIACDPKRSRPDGACESCRVGRYTTPPEGNLSLDKTCIYVSKDCNWLQQTLLFFVLKITHNEMSNLKTKTKLNCATAPGENQTIDVLKVEAMNIFFFCDVTPLAC
jgi:hypothetical protein